MELFEILFVLLFILFPIIEQVLKRSRGKPDGTQQQGRGPSRSGTRSPSGEGDTPSREREPVTAADMVPDDLWAILTGEQRKPGGVTTRETGADREAGRAEPWSLEPDRAPEPDLVEFDLSEPDEPEAEPRELARTRGGSPRSWTVDDEAEPAPPVSLEYEGPEAYSLETLDHPPQSLDRPVPRPRRRRSAIGRALQDPQGVRNAIVLAEVLGPPKGLE